MKIRLCSLQAALAVIGLFGLLGCGDRQSSQTDNQDAAASLSEQATSEANNADSASPLGQPTPSTFARFVPERKDDFAWENDLVAFRAYGPALRDSGENAGVDCWLKKVPYPIIDKWYKQHLEDDISYHTDHGEGLDNYHVGASAGCGGTAIWLNEQRMPLEAYVSYEILSSTPAKTVFQLNYEHTIGADTYTESKLITIELGQRLYKVVSTFTKNGQVAANIPTAIGVTTHEGKAIPSWDAEQGWLIAWEKLGEYSLGTGVKVNPGQVRDVKIIQDASIKDFSHALLIVNTDENGQLQYASGYGWEGAGEIVSVDDWQAYIENSGVLD